MEEDLEDDFIFDSIFYVKADGIMEEDLKFELNFDSISHINADELREEDIWLKRILTWCYDLMLMLMA